MKDTVKNAGFIRAVLDGKTVQYLRFDGEWRDLDDAAWAIEMLAKPAYGDSELRLKPEPLVTYVHVYPYEGTFVFQSCREHLLRMRKDLTGKLLRLELDPDTLEVLSAKTEQP